MEELFDILPLLIMGVVITIIGKFKKTVERRQTQSTPSTQRTGTAARRFPADPFAPQSWKAIFEDVLQEAKQTTAPARVAAPARTAPSPTPVDRAQPLAEGMSSFMEGISTDGSRPSLEGIDTCDPSLGHTTTSFWEEEAQTGKAASLSPRPASAGPLPLSFTSDALVQGFVMSEILARPGQRKWSHR